MAFGFPAYHTEEAIGSGDENRLRNSVKNAILSLGWNIHTEATTIITASTSPNLSSWGEGVVIHFFPGCRLSVTSKCALFTQCFDWGKNKRNVRTLFEEIAKHS